jgi:energy-coupling factor transport system ATP-binding protein
MSDALPISLRNLTFTYRIRKEPAIKNINLDLHPGELMLVAGSSGCGKTTLMRCVNGLIPRSYTGEIQGEINIFGRKNQEMTQTEISQKIGTVLQNPERQIVASYVLNEVAFGLENLGYPREEILRKVDETLDYLNILHLKDRETFSLSGGEKQKVALAGVLAMDPKVLLLDEPLASLDPASAAEALRLFKRLSQEGISVMLVEHRVDDVLAIEPDTIVYMDNGEIKYQGDKQGLMQIADYKQVKLPAEVVIERAKKDPIVPFESQVGKRQGGQIGDQLLSFNNVTFSYSEELPSVLKNVTFEVKKGDCIAVLGHNGAGKSTLIKHALGLLKPAEGQVFLEGQDTKDLIVSKAAHTIGYVFQDPGQMIFETSVEKELSFGPHNLGHTEEEIEKDVQWALKTVNIEEFREDPPLALSFGQQKRVSIASVLSMRSRILVMDEPTAGQDFWNYRAFMDGIIQMPGFDAIIFITHDLDLALTYSNKVLLINKGEVQGFGPTEEILQQEETLRKCRVLPTTLLETNIKYLPQTGRFMRAEELAHLI